MPNNGHHRLMSELVEQYTRRFPGSATLQEEAHRHLIDGGNHAVRLFEPYPIRVVSARGSHIQDVDGHEILDFWQGHYANILGHNPQVVTQALANELACRGGLQTGHVDRLQVELAELLKERTGTDRVRFTTSGTLATMYAILLARAFTGRDLALKVGGGWHGSQPWGLKGIHFGERGFSEVESLGLPRMVTDEILITRFNDPDYLERQFHQHGDRIACFIVEPWIGGVFIPAKPEYLEAARSLTRKHGALLIFDEVQTGFRFRSGDVGTMYGIHPDLTVFGKIVGAGMPLTAVVGREEVMRVCSKERELRARFDGGTFSAHPASVLAAKTMLEYLVENEASVYAKLADFGKRARKGVEEAFARHGIFARCTGYGNEAVPGSSVASVHFPLQEDIELDCPDKVQDPKICDVALRESVLKLALLLENVYVMHGLGALSTAHTEKDIDHLLAAFDTVSRRIRDNLSDR